MRPFFKFYGGKWRLAPRYPKPSGVVVVEPFAGSAGYSVRNDVEVAILVERDPIIAETWRYLIGAKPSEIMALPDLEPGQTTDDLVDLPPGARHLIGWWLNSGVARPCKTPGKWMREVLAGKYPSNKKNVFWGPSIRARIADQLEGIRKWQIVEGDWSEAPEDLDRTWFTNVTWFVDPPYVGKSGRHYARSAVDYEELGEWCRTRPGLVIACEGAGADWLPFEYLAVGKSNSSSGVARRSVEMVWTNEEGGER